MLAHIIAEQGWRAPITVSRRSGYIVRGHARRLASYEAGSRYAPIEWQDYDNDSAEMADLVADNRIAELAVLDQDAIAGILAELKENTDDLDPELSGFTAEQIEANVSNWEEISHISVLDDAPEVTPPTWINGDSSHIDELAPGEYDLFFTCPPYADLEVYSDKLEDLSNKEYPEFLQLYRNVIRRATAMLKPDSFAVIVVSDLRDKKGFYRNFVSDTIDAFQDVGLKFYNEAILVNTAGGLAIRVGKQFEHSRKMGKDHQNVLVFCNGDPAQSAAFRTEDPQGYAEDINSYLKAGAGKLGVNHEKVLVFAKGDPEKAAEIIGTPETAEEADRYDNTALLKEILGEDTGDE